MPLAASQLLLVSNLSKELVEDTPVSTGPSQLCQVCTEVSFRYRCPACSVHSCSLSCVKKHKESSGCLGVRPASEFIPVKEMNDQTLIRDFTLLETAQNVVTRPVKSEQTSSLAQKRAALKKLCYDRGIWLKTMPCVFARAKVNTSHVRRKTELWWRVEWRFPSVIKPDGSSLVLSDTYVEETIPLQDLVNRFFDNTWKIAPVKHQLIALEGKTLQFSLATEPECPLDASLPLKDLLKAKVVYEFPVVLVSEAASTESL